MAELVFYVLAAGAVAFGLLVVLGRNPAICAVNLVGAFLCLSGIYLLIGFPFLAALQLIVYAGAIMVLFVFVIMLLDLRKEQPTPRLIALMTGSAVSGVLLAVIALFMSTMVEPVSGKKGPYVMDRVLAAPLGGEASTSGGSDLATALFSRHVLAFEATSLLLLAAIVGVIVFAKKLATREQLIATGDAAPGAANPENPEAAQAPTTQGAASSSGASA